MLFQKARLQGISFFKTTDTIWQNLKQESDVFLLAEQETDMFISVKKILDVFKTKTSSLNGGMLNVSS